jgi:hypothetical protein
MTITKQLINRQETKNAKKKTRRFWKYLGPLRELGGSEK